MSYVLLKNQISTAITILAVNGNEIADVKISSNVGFVLVFNCKWSKPTKTLSLNELFEVLKISVLILYIFDKVIFSLFSCKAQKKKAS